MKVEEIRKIARGMEIGNAGRMRKGDLIHAIQRTEGNFECFATDPHSCGQDNCLWRADCFIAVKDKGN